jgi:hypothetical protein
VTALDYRSIGIDYRQSDASYQGVLDAAIAASIIAGVATVAAPIATGNAEATGTVVAASVTLPPATVAADGNAAPASIATTATVASASPSGAANAAPAATQSIAAVGVADVSVTAVVAANSISGTILLEDASASSTVSVAAAVVSCVGTIPAHQAGMSSEATPDTVTIVGSVNALTPARHADTGVVAGVPRREEGAEFYNPLAVANRLARFYTPINRGINVWIVDNATVVTSQPDPTANVTRIVYGGHEGQDLTETEADLLAAAGYIVNVEQKAAA